MNIFPRELKGVRFYLIGIKGQGMTALAEILYVYGAQVSGSDTKDLFYTDAILKALKIPYREGFAASNLQGPLDFVIYSPAYSADSHPELRKAYAEKYTVLSYPQALGELSRIMDFSGVSGVHGKTTTTAMCGLLAAKLKLPVTVLVGSQVPGFGNRSSLVTGKDYFIAETCEYKRHFLNYSPRRIILTSVEADHLDYFKDISDIEEAFLSYIDLLPQGGLLIYCYDDKGAQALAKQATKLRPDLRYLPYGQQAAGPYTITHLFKEQGKIIFKLKGFAATFELFLPGEHNVYNATAALALVFDIADAAGLNNSDYVPLAKEVLQEFSGTKRRCEKVAQIRDILIMDDYAHHPTAIAKTLRGLAEFYPRKRLIVDFMSHTYSRTRALLKDFGTAFEEADMVVLHKIYASAREQPPGDFSGKDLYDEVCKHHDNVHYFPEPVDSLLFIQRTLKPGDIFLTMGAGDNWRVGIEIQALLGKE